MLRIWGRTNSINVKKVLGCCAELDLPFERIDAGMAFGVVETAAYRALNPNGRIPTLEDDGYVLWESNTILRYLATKHGIGSLCPSDLAARFDAERWMDWQLTTLDRPVRNVFWALVRTPPQERDLAALEAAQAEAKQALAILDRRLAQRRFVGGEAFTMGDIPVGASVHRWLALDLHRAAACSALVRSAGRTPRLLGACHAAPELTRIVPRVGGYTGCVDMLVC